MQKIIIVLPLLGLFVISGCSDVISLAQDSFSTSVPLSSIIVDGEETTNDHITVREITPTPIPTIDITEDYLKFYPAYQKDLGDGQILYSKIPLPPPIKVWNYEIQYDDTYYCAVIIEETTTAVSMTGYWEVVGEVWKFRNTTITLDKKQSDINITAAPLTEILIK